MNGDRRAVPADVHIGLERGPVVAGKGLDLKQANLPASRFDRVTGTGGDQLFNGEGGIAGHAAQADGAAQMGDDHAIGEERRAAQIAFPQGREAGDADRSGDDEAKERQDADAAPGQNRHQAEQ